MKLDGQRKSVVPPPGGEVDEEGRAVVGVRESRGVMLMWCPLVPEPTIKSVPSRSFSASRVGEAGVIV